MHLNHRICRIDEVIVGILNESQFHFIDARLTLDFVRNGHENAVRCARIFVLAAVHAHQRGAGTDAEQFAVFDAHDVLVVRTPIQVDGRRVGRRDQRFKFIRFVDADGDGLGITFARRVFAAHDLDGFGIIDRVGKRFEVIDAISPRVERVIIYLQI